MKYSIHQPYPLIECLLFQSMGGICACALSYSGAAMICQEGAKARERSERGEGAVPPSDGRDIFENLGMNTAFSCTLNVITMG